MTIYTPPALTDDDHLVLEMIGEQRQRLKHYIHNDPQRWDGMLRRNMMARAIQGSNTIEGYNATIDDVVAGLKDEEPMDANVETWRNILGYRNAMTYIIQLSEDEHFEFHPQLLRSLHFMMLQHDLTKLPGRWRPGEIFVYNDQNEEVVYTGPDALMLQDLIDELMDYLNGPSDCPIMVKAAMAHLNLTMIHPFKDGNGRMARALQTLVLSREGIVSPLFSSIEEWLGRNTEAYYDILAETGHGAWHPENDAHGWVEFCLKAHFQQARTIVKRNEWFRQIYREIQKIQTQHNLPDRTYTALMDAAMGLRVRAGVYREENEVSQVVASRDLTKLAGLELLVPHGEKKGRYYTGSRLLLDIAFKHKVRGKAENPYDLLEEKRKAQEAPELPLGA